MGILIHCGLQDFFYEAVREDLSGKKLLMLGKQDISHSRAEVYVFAKKLGARLDYEKLKVDQRTGLVDSYSFFYALGFHEVHALDIQDYEGADFIFDLNRSDLPKEMHNCFDYIHDGGTTEHVFDYAQAMRNIVSMLKEGGKVFHYLPADRQVNHGYYSLSPSLFRDFYRSNGFRIERLDIILKKTTYGTPIQSMGDCVATEPDYRIYNLRDTYGLSDYIGTLRCIATKLHQKDLADPKQTHWYGWVKEDLLREMWWVDCEMDKENPSVGVWGTDHLSKLFLDVVSRHPGFTRGKLKGFFTYDETAGQNQLFLEYPLMGVSRILDVGVRTLFLSTLDRNIYEKFKVFEQRGIKLVPLADYLPALQAD